MTITIDRALLEKLIGEYFDIGWREGFENRHHDDEQVVRQAAQKGEICFRQKNLV